jgi:hypothetical protein
MDPSLLRGVLHRINGCEEGPYGGAGWWLHPPDEVRAGIAVHPCLPCVFKQGVAEPVVLSPERRRDAPTVFSTSGDRRRRQLALGGHTRKLGEAPAHPPCPTKVANQGPYHCGGCRRHPPPEGAPIGRAAVAAFGDEAGANLDGSRMSSTSLSADDLLRRVAGTVGRLDAGVLSQPPMRPDHGYVSLVSVRPSFCLAPCFLRL